MRIASTPPLCPTTATSDECVNEFKSLSVRIKQANKSNNLVKQSDTAHADWTTYKVKAEMAFRYGNFGEAESAWLKALELTQLFKTDDPRRVYTFECLSSFYLAERNLDKAESYARQALYLTQETCGQNDPRVAVSLNSLVDIYDRAGRWLEAEALCVRMLIIYYKNYGSDHSDVGAIANKLALIYHGLGKLDLAELMYERAMPIRAKALGANHPAYQTLLNNYATLLETTNRKEKALLFRGLPSSVNWASFQCQISTIKLSN